MAVVEARKVYVLVFVYVRAIEVLTVSICFPERLDNNDALMEGEILTNAEASLEIVDVSFPYVSPSIFEIE